MEIFPPPIAILMFIFIYYIFEIIGILIAIFLKIFRYLIRSHSRFASTFDNQYGNLKASPQSITPPPPPTRPSPAPPPLSPPPPLLLVEEWGGVLYLLSGLLLCFIFFIRTRRRSRATKKVRSPPVYNPPQPQARGMNGLVNCPTLTDVTRYASSPVTLPNPTLTNARSVASVSPVVSKLGRTVFPYKQLLRATNNFSTANRLGVGGFGAVYKGTFPDDKIVAVKLLKEVNDIDFHKEVDVNSRVKHKHIVSFFGYCIHGDLRLIVLEYVENNSLHHHLHGGNSIQGLDWANRVKIALGTAKGLEYLHDGCHPTIIHRDVKPANIHLNNNFEAKVADFGIARVCPESFDIYLYTGAMGTPGYVDPDYFHTQKLTVKSDVYSFGIVLLELVTGFRPQLIHDMINKLPKALKKGNFDSLVDPRLQNNYDAREMHMIFACADACIRKMATDRPLMTKIVRVLKGEIPHGELKMKTKRLF